MSTVFSNLEVNNMSLLTYGAIGMTSIILAVVTIFDSEGGEEMASAVQPEIEPPSPRDDSFSNTQEKPTENGVLPEVFSNTDSEESQIEEPMSNESVSENKEVEDSLSENIEASAPPTSEFEEDEDYSLDSDKKNDDVRMGGKNRKSKKSNKTKGKKGGKKNRKTRSK